MKTAQASTWIRVDYQSDCPHCGSENEHTQECEYADSIRTNIVVECFECDEKYEVYI